MSKTSKILFVDDEPDVLSAIARRLRKRFDLETAQGSMNGLLAASSRGPFAVAVSDLRMPGLDGVEFLRRLKTLSPDTVRVLFTGNADLDSALEAVNRGHVFRILTKDCSEETLLAVLEECLRQHRLVTAEKELLVGTLQGVIKLLTDLLFAASPEALGRATRAKRLAGRMAQYLGLPDAWRVEMAAALSQVGSLLLPAETVARAARGESLAPEEREALERCPLLARDLLLNIPRMEEVARMVACQDRDFDAPEDAEGEVPAGARLLKAALDCDALLQSGRAPAAALAELRQRDGRYDPAALEALGAVLELQQGWAFRYVRVQELTPGMILDQDVLSRDNDLLCAQGYEVTPALLLRLREATRTAPAREPVRVLLPPARENGGEA